jgi:hypothetical protein
MFKDNFKRVSAVVFLMVFTITSAPLSAEPLTPDQFDSLVTGRTLTFSRQGVLFGIEQYLPDRRSLWARDDGICQYGKWHSVGRDICFVYNGESGPHCWVFEEVDGKLTAFQAGEVSEDRLVVTDVTEAPLACTPPGLGV